MDRLDRIRQVLGLLIPVSSMVWVLSIPQRLGLFIFPEQILAFMLGTAMCVVYLGGIENRTNKFQLPVVLALLSMLCGLYLTWRIPILSEEAFFRPVETLIISSLSIALLLEAMRRSVGASLVWVFLLFALYGLFGDLIPGKMQGRVSTPAELLSFLGTDTTAMLGLPLTVTCFVVVMFILFGRVLQTTGGTEFFTGLSRALAGNGPGSPAKVSIIASSLFGSISGSAVSNVMSTGVITIPTMMKHGIPPYRAGAIESVASTGGQLMPPIMGAAAFLMAEFLQIPYKDIIIAALLPAVLYYLALFLQVDFISRRQPQHLEETQEHGADSTIKASSVLKKGWLLPVPFAVLIVALFKFNLSPEFAVLLAVSVLALLSFLRNEPDQRMTPARIFTDLAATGQSVAELLLVTAVAGMIIGILSNTGLSFSLGFVLLDFGEGSLVGLLVLTALVCIILGMGLPTTGVYLLLATLAAPPLVQLGLQPLQAHLFVLYFGMLSMITPPVALAAFAAASLSGAGQMRTGFEAMRLGWCAYLVPFLFIYHPALLFQGSALEIMQTLVSIVLALLLISAVLAGFGVAAISIAGRVLALLLAVPLLFPLPEHLKLLVPLVTIVSIALITMHVLQARKNHA